MRIGQTTILSLLLLLISLLNALYLFSRHRSYRLQMRSNPQSIGSPNAKVVDVDDPVEDTFGNGLSADRRGWLENVQRKEFWLDGLKMVLFVLLPSFYFHKPQLTRFAAI